MTHISVLLAEAVEALAIQPSGLYVDGTFGRGGHSREILDRLGPEGRLVAFDRDPAAVEVAGSVAALDSRFTIVPRAFSGMGAWLRAEGLAGRVDGILLDLGVSSPQLDEPDRGFSFMQDGPLDMRMDPGSGLSAAQWLAEVDLDELTQVLRNYGEERHARRIARHLVETRAERPMRRTRELAERIREAVPGYERNKHPATRCFQAIRIRVNGELDELQAVLDDVTDLLAPGGRLVVISFHSLEDRLVKRFIRAHSEPEKDFFGQPVGRPPLVRLGKPVRAGDDELGDNPRSRSAVMRVAQRTGS
ncbi:MAG: 16S rRNA (cytosine(1402)-N(4))-methyltransferase RsmH [Halothiobacillaceae bacterium]